jgi:hypothetical protein
MRMISQVTFTKSHLRKERTVQPNNQTIPLPLKSQFQNLLRKLILKYRLMNKQNQTNLLRMNKRSEIKKKQLNWKNKKDSKLRKIKKSQIENRESRMNKKRKKKMQLKS